MSLIPSSPMFDSIEVISDADQGFAPTGPSTDEILNEHLRSETYVDLAAILRGLEACKGLAGLRSAIVELASEEEKLKLIADFEEAK